jgi:hypothetical protein
MCGEDNLLQSMSRMLSRETILATPGTLGFITPARAHGMQTYEPRQGRKAATVVCSVSAVVTLAFFSIQNFKCKIKNDCGAQTHFAFLIFNF